MSVLYKTPTATKTFFVEFSNQLVSGDSLASITSVTEATAAITISGETISGTQVQASYSGGVDGTTYTITATVVTTNGETLDVDVYLRVIDNSSAAYATSYFGLLERVGHFLFGIRSNYSGDQVSDIEQCIDDGLKYVYAAHAWSFFRPIEDITTTAPYATGTVTIASGVVTLTTGTFPSWAADGILKVSNSYYSVATRDSGTQITLDDTSVTVATASGYELGRPEIPLDASFEDMSDDRALTYYPDQNELYPPVQNRHDQWIRTKQQDDPYYDRPVAYSIRTVEFDPTVGSRKRLAFYPTPDAAYVLRAPMILRPVPITPVNPYPVGGEMLSILIIEACLCAAEKNFDEIGNQHTGLFTELLPRAIEDDQERSSPTRLGPDMPKGEGYHFDVYDWDHHARAVRMGALTLDGTTL